VSPQNIADVLKQDGSLEARCKRLIELARDQGAPDNVTVVLLESPKA
jgi:serine/threonine protein phosphatase PrpC